MYEYNYFCNNLIFLYNANILILFLLANEYIAQYLAYVEKHEFCIVLRFSRTINGRMHKKTQNIANKLRKVRQTGAILVSQVCQVVLPLLSSAHLSFPLFLFHCLSSFVFSSISSICVCVSFPSFFVCSGHALLSSLRTYILSTIQISVSPLPPLYFVF